MSDKMIPISFENILNKIKLEYSECKTIFGIHKSHFVKIQNQNSYNFFGSDCESPIGPAAGPHTQMTQNIISAFLCGARFFELKTVQILDNLEIDKPCILIKNEGYNTEWSQELSLEESYDEYLKAWLILHILNGIIFKSKIPGNFIFNMSVGYDLKGIMSDPVNSFIEKMISADEKKFEKYLNISRSFIEGIDQDLFNFSNDDQSQLLKEIESIPKQISNSVTISTMHGCPPEEIEKIAEYLITQKRIHTYIKLNPTLLGYDAVKNIISESGYKNIKLKKESFTNDLQFNDAVDLIKKLQKIAIKEKLTFGLKLSNTLPVSNYTDALPGDEMYLSGRILFPITINVADKLVEHIGSTIPVSFSGGADVINIRQILNCGIKPVTFATDLLKPGGYYRINQICKISINSEFPSQLNQIELRKLAEESLNSEYYKFSENIENGVSINRKLEMFDCYTAPCVLSCPIGQDIPAYLNYCDIKDYDSAAKVILAKNPLPNITSYICDHQCQFNCTRIEYDSSVEIREFKKAAIENAKELNFERRNIQKDVKVAVIGSGPAGLSLANYLSREGITVEIFEKKSTAGGVVQNYIPQFRIPEKIIERDLEYLEKLGVKFHFNSAIEKLDDLVSNGFKYIFVGIGAGISNEIRMEKSDKPQLHALDILWQLKNEPERCKISGKVAVIGGGNSAMDCARAVKRVRSVNEVFIIYRRTEELMPADKEEFMGALEDGVIFMPLLQPFDFLNGILKCRQTKLGKKIKNGRPEILFTDNSIEFEFDHLVSAVGEHADTHFFNINNIGLDEHENPVINPKTNESSRKNVFMGGDCVTGPRTVIEAAGDAQKVAKEILKRENLSFKTEMPELLKRSSSLSIQKIIDERGKVYGRSEISENTKCLNCDLLCNKCVEVCPNRANISLKVNSDKFKDINQIIHIDSLCNECGNCSQFCPYEGDPYIDKFTIFNSEKDFEDSRNQGIFIQNEKIKLKFKNTVSEFNIEEIANLEIPARLKEIIVKVTESTYLL